MEIVQDIRRLLNNPLIKDDISAVNEGLQALAREAPRLLRPSLATLVEAPAKRLRAGLVIISGRFGKYDSNSHILAAEAIEAIHLASLIHDDIIDESPIRRGVPTINASHGAKSAIFAGDYMLARAVKLLSSVFSPRDLFHIGSIVEGLCNGEILQHELRYSPEITEELYLQWVRQKTSSLTALSCWAGARLARLSPRLISALTDYGDSLGVAFQIADDLMDFLSSENETGKPVLNDIRQGVYSLPVIFALDHGNGHELKELLLEGRNTPEALYAAVDMVEKSGGIQYAQDVARSYSEKAIEALQKLPGGPYKDILIDLAIASCRRSS
ncbi:MAG TPA: polyprenyl synthetase family protein [Firmicutes bacterium]|nr:polyprenyl synthetase family protein [Bacillota bacterium]